MAFRLLRQLSAQVSSSDKVLDVEGTIRDTCDQAGTLKIRYKNPRKNTTKVLLLMDCGGSMEYYSELCSTLFQAATKSNTFQELQTFYFHNCIYASVYRHPWMRPEDNVQTEWLLQNFDSTYKVIIVGDAAMNPEELLDKDVYKRQVTPTTNPIVTPCQNSMIALKGGNAIIICPHPRSKKCVKRTVDLMRGALKEVGAPEDLIQVVEEPTSEYSNPVSYTHL